MGGGVVKVAAQGAFLSGTDPGSCCVALQFPDSPDQDNDDVILLLPTFKPSCFKKLK